MLIKTLRGSEPFGLVAGLNVIENFDSMKRVADKLSNVTEKLKISFVFKASFDKANRSNAGAFRGPGLVRGLELLHRLKSESQNLAIVTDIHEAYQAELVKQAGMDMIQIPSFLCRQSDLITAAAETGLPLLLKKGKFMAFCAFAGQLTLKKYSPKGQFASPDVMKAAVQKAKCSMSYAGSIVCERGTNFGPENLVVDVRDLVRLRDSGALVALDATHAAQRPAARTSQGLGSDGDLFAVEAIAKAGVATGIDVLFMEVHEHPARAPVDAKVQWPLDSFEPFLAQLIRIAQAAVN